MVQKNNWNVQFKGCDRAPGSLVRLVTAPVKKGVSKTDVSGASTMRNFPCETVYKTLETPLIDLDLQSWRDMSKLRVMNAPK